jgi:hypothetical protein
MSATVTLMGVQQEPVQGRDSIVSQTPHFLVGVVTCGESQGHFGLEANGQEALHAVLDILADAAQHRGRGFTVTDNTGGAAGLLESCRPENQVL